MTELKEDALVASVSLVVAFTLVIIIYVWQNRKDLAFSRRSAYPPAKGIYLGLRNQILQGSRATFNLPQTTPTQPWGVVMDWGVTEGLATAVALSDGTASIYLSSGGGYIGGQAHDSIRRVAQTTVEIAAEFQPQMQATSTFPLPKQGEVIFYILTDSGVFTASVPEQELRTHRHPLWKLGDAVQAIITQYRQLK
jgi:hypothetical protein